MSRVNKSGVKTCNCDGVVCHTSMPDEIQVEAVACARSAVRKYGANKRKEIAAYICKEFDEHYGGNWHCVIGRDFK